MHQAGLIAACGIIAIEKMVDRLKDDHMNALLLAQELNKMPNISVSEKDTQINIVFAKINKSKEFIAQIPSLLLENGVKVNGEEGGYIRFVTNNDVTKNDILKVIDIFRNIMK